MGNHRAGSERRDRGDAIVGTTPARHLRDRRRALLRDPVIDSLRLLVVEDSPQDRQAFECLVEDLRRECAVGIDCEFAASGPQALALIDRQHHDAVILDQHMPEMSGSEAMTALKGIFLHRRDRPKILAYSALDAPEFRHQCLAEGADAFMPKYMGAAQFARGIRGLGLSLGFGGTGKRA